MFNEVVASFGVQPAAEEERSTKKVCAQRNTVDAQGTG